VKATPVLHLDQNDLEAVKKALDYDYMDHSPEHVVELVKEGKMLAIRFWEGDDKAICVYHFNETAHQLQMFVWLMANISGSLTGHVAEMSEVLRQIAHDAHASKIVTISRPTIARALESRAGWERHSVLTVLEV
jgi:hypothetical protein